MRTQTRTPTLLFSLWASCFLSSQALAFQASSVLPPSPDTQLVDLRLNTGFARQLQPVREGGYEAAQGEWISFQRWYAPAWRDVSLTLMTPLSPRVGLLWGLSTGERAAKYTVDPGLRLGLVFQTELSRQVSLSFKATHVLGGRLKERSCQANYGAITGHADVEVNCRLAASALAPRDTLNLMLNGRPDNATEFRAQVTYRF